MLTWSSLRRLCWRGSLLWCCDRFSASPLGGAWKVCCEGDEAPDEVAWLLTSLLLLLRARRPHPQGPLTESSLDLQGSFSSHRGTGRSSLQALPFPSVLLRALSLASGSRILDLGWRHTARPLYKKGVGASLTTALHLKLLASSCPAARPHLLRPLVRRLEVRTDFRESMARARDGAREQVLPHLGWKPKAAARSGRHVPWPKCTATPGRPMLLQPGFCTTLELSGRPCFGEQGCL